MRAHPARVVRAGLLLALALLVAKLFVAGEMARYLSPALDPLTALAGLLLAGMGLGELWSARRTGAACESDGHSHATDPADLVVTALMVLVPVVLGVAITPRALGSSALGGAGVSGILLSFGGGAPAVLAEPPAPTSPIEDVVDLLAYLRQAGETGVGQPVRAIGLVARDDGLGSDEFALLRYTIVHCVADAQPIGLLVLAPDGRQLPVDQWVEVEGRLVTREKGGERMVAIQAATITPTEEPRNPYLSGIG